MSKEYAGKTHKKKGDSQNRLDLIEEMAQKIKEDTGYSLPKGIPEPSDNRALFPNEASLMSDASGQYISEAFSKNHNELTVGGRKHIEDEKVEPNSIYLKDGVTEGSLEREVEATLYHEFAHAVHIQNNESLNDALDHLYGLSNILGGKRGKVEDTEEIREVMSDERTEGEMNDIVYRLRKRYSIAKNLFDVKVEGFASWLTNKKFPDTSAAETSSEGLEIYKTLEEAYGFDKTVEIAMDPEKTGQIIELYEEACEKLDEKQKVSRGNQYTILSKEFKFL